MSTDRASTAVFPVFTAYPQAPLPPKMSVSLRQLPKKVLIVTKVTRFESVSKRFGGKRGTELIQELRARGLPHDRIRTSHETHHAALNKIVDGLRKSWRCDVAVVSAPSLVSSQFDNVDAVFTAGGDGTVLETALHIHSNMCKCYEIQVEQVNCVCICIGLVPVVSVNTDPILSTGFLCAYKLHANGCFVEGFLEKLKKLEFEWQFRSRIQITLGGNKKLPNLALNEVFFAEADPRYVEAVWVVRWVAGYNFHAVGRRFTRHFCCDRMGR